MALKMPARLRSGPSMGPSTSTMPHGSAEGSIGTPMPDVIKVTMPRKKAEVCMFGV